MNTTKIFNYCAQKYAREWQQGVRRQNNLFKLEEFHDMTYNSKQIIIKCS